MISDERLAPVQKPYGRQIMATYWDMPFDQLCDFIGMGAQPGSPAAESARATLDARLALRQIEATEAATASAKASADAARRTVWATWALVAATIVLVVVTGIIN